MGNQKNYENLIWNLSQERGGKRRDTYPKKKKKKENIKNKISLFRRWLCAHRDKKEGLTLSR